MDQIRLLLREIFDRFEEYDDEGLLTQLQDAIIAYRIDRDAEVAALMDEHGDLR